MRLSRCNVQKIDRKDGHISDRDHFDDSGFFLKTAEKSKKMAESQNLGSLWLAGPTSTYNATSFYSYIDRCVIYILLKNWALNLFLWPTRA